MKGRIRMAAAGLVVMTVLTAVTATAGAVTVTQWNVTGNGGFVSLELLNAQQLAPAEAAAVTPAARADSPATPAVVPNVTTVHTGEFWWGSVLIILLAGMGLAGALLIGRRRIVAVARSINPSPVAGAAHEAPFPTRHLGSRDGPPPGPALGTSSVPPPVSGAGPAAASNNLKNLRWPPGRTTTPPGDPHTRRLQETAETPEQISRRAWREKQMQREPVLRAARNGKADSRSGQWQPDLP